MIEALKAIQTTFASNAALVAMFPSGLFLSLETPVAPLPTCVLTVIGAAPDWNTSSNYINEIQVQFATFAVSDTAALQGNHLIKSAFDFATLTMADDTTVIVMRTAEGITRDDERTWQGILTYSVQVVETYGTGAD